MSNAFSSNESDHVPLGSTESRSRGYRSPSSGSGASAPAAHRPDAPSVRELRALQQLEAGRPPYDAALLPYLERFNDLLDTAIQHLGNEVVNRRMTVAPDPPDLPDCRAEVRKTEKLCKKLSTLNIILLCILGEWDPRPGRTAPEVTGQDGH